MSTATSVAPTAPPVNPRSFTAGDRVTIAARGYYHGMRGTVRRGYTAGNIRSYYVEVEDGFTVAFDWYELRREVIA